MQNQPQSNYSWRSLGKAMWFLWGIGNLKWKYLLWLVLLFIILGYAAVPPLVLGYIVDFFARYKAGDSLRTFYNYSIFLGASMIAVSWVRLTIKKQLGLLRAKSTYHMRVQGFESLLSQALLGQHERTAGEKAQRIQNGTDAFNSLLHILTNQLLSGIAATTSIILVFLFLRPGYILFFSGYIICFLAILSFFQNKLFYLNLEKNRALEKASGTYMEGLGGVATLKAAWAERSYLDQVSQRESTSRMFQNRIINTTNRQWKTFQAFNGLAIGLFLFLVGREVSLGIIGIGSIVVLYSYLEKLIGSADQTMSLYNDLIQAKAGIGRLMDIFRQKPARAEGTRSWPSEWKKLEVKKGFFEFKVGEKSSSGRGLRDINLEVRKGGCVAIVGRTGSGKTTLARLLMGLYDWQGGAYLINDTNMAEIRSEEISRHFSMIVQDPEIFNISILDNITLFRNVTPEKITQAIETARLQEVIERLPAGMETILGEKGQRLSQGERQRVSIARALCQPGDILILDEATSALDGATQESVLHALQENFPEKTLIMIAHRPETLKRADRVYVLEDGRMVEEGMYEELNARPESLFNRILGAR